MENTNYMRLRGSQNLRLRLLLSTLSSKPILIEEIRTNGNWPGLCPHEISFLRLFEKICDDCVVKINHTGTKVKYKPGIVMGGRNLFHDCGLSRSIGYFLEPLVVLALFGKKPLSIRLQGITNDSNDPSVDTFWSTTMNILKKFGVPSEGLDLKIESRGVPPLGGGVVFLTVPIVHNTLTAVDWTDGGMVKRIRGVTFSTKVSSQFENTMIHAARGILNPLLSDIHVFTDHKAGSQAGNSPGYGISLVAETTSGCFISADTAISNPYLKNPINMEELEKKPLMPADEVGEKTASFLLQELKEGGVVDSAHQGLLFVLCALCPEDISKVRVGKLSLYGIQALKLIRDFLNNTFAILPDPSTGTLILKCKGSGVRNLFRKAWLIT
ncbi:hypothetical protein V2J09_001683 [Rumex salicifolius]